MLFFGESCKVQTNASGRIVMAAPPSRSRRASPSFPRENRNWTFNGPTVQFAISEPFAVTLLVRLCNAAA